jgi:hypothetical protein
VTPTAVARNARWSAEVVERLLALHDVYPFDEAVFWPVRLDRHVPGSPFPAGGAGTGAGLFPKERSSKPLKPPS